MADTATPTLLEDLQAKRSTLVGELDALIDAREDSLKEIEAREGEPTDEQKAADQAASDDFRSALEALEADIAPLEDRIEQQKDKAERRKVAEAAGAGKLEVTHEPAVYREDNADSENRSYFRDLLIRYPEHRHLAPRGAEQRLETHRKETEDRLDKKAQLDQRKAEIGIEQAEAEFRNDLPGHIGARGFADENPFERRANPSRETGHGGEFVPPLWLVEDDFIPALRAGRVIAPQLRNLPVPPGTDTIKLPKIKLGTEVAPQLQDAAGVASRDVESEFVEAAVKTIAGQEDVAIQLIEQSPGQVFDRVVQEDLLADYNRQLDREVSIGRGTNYTTLNAGTIRGLFPAKEWGGSVHLSTTSLAVAPLLGAMATNWSHIAKERFNTKEVKHFFHPSFIAWMANAGDVSGGESGRPVVTSPMFNEFNIFARLSSSEIPSEGEVGRTQMGDQIFHTANIPPILPMAKTESGEQKEILFSTNKEAKELVTSGAEVHSYLLTVKADDCWFFESDLRTRVLPEVLSGTLQIRFQVYSYISLLVRYGPSLQIAGGKPFICGTSFTAAPTEPVFGGYKL